MTLVWLTTMMGEICTTVKGGTTFAQPKWLGGLCKLSRPIS
jgi:hypothetical protein